MNFLLNLDTLLTINKMSRSELARNTKIAPSTISSWYTKDYRGITLKNLLKISSYFDVTIEDLVNGDIRSLRFSADKFSDSELKAIRDFSHYIKARS